MKLNNSEIEPENENAKGEMLDVIVEQEEFPQDEFSVDFSYNNSPQMSEAMSYVSNDSIEWHETTKRN
jgi:hypothetical protein